MSHVIRQVSVEDRASVFSDGRQRYVGISLHDLVDIIGGYSGQLVNPATGQPEEIDLRAWENTPDPTSVWLDVGFFEEVKADGSPS
jgi:hypothetical protein